MSTESQRPRPRQDQARQLFEAACELIRIAGEPWPRMQCLRAHGGGFHVAKGALSLEWAPRAGQDQAAGLTRAHSSPGSIAVDIWPVQQHQLAPDGRPLTGKKIFGCDVESDGQIYLRSFRRGAWEDRFLSYADATVQLDDVQPPLAIFDVRDERLMSTQRLCDLCLRHAGLAPLRDQQLRESLVARGVDGLRHRPPDER